MIVAIDDLHKVLDWDAASAAIEHAANTQCDLVLLTCGPTPECASFLRDKQELVSVIKFDTPDLTQADASAIGEHLGVQIDASNAKPPTLVEQLFWGLGGSRDLATFAKSLHSRVDARVGQEGLLAQLTALTWMDVPFPADQLAPLAQSRIEELADETQLHFEQIPGGYRFGHPAIAKPIFHALTAGSGISAPLAVRLAETLSPVLRNMEASARRRALRQIAPRLAKDADLTTIDVLTILYKSAAGAALAADIASNIIKLRPSTSGGDEQLKWLRAARTFRDNNSIDPRIRAELATCLVLREPMDEQDLRVALNLTADPLVGAHCGEMLSRLLARRTTGVAFKSLPHAINWASRNTNNKQQQKVVSGLLSSYPNDSRVRKVVLELIRDTEVAELRSPMIVSLAKFMEVESESLVMRWLSSRGASSQAGHVLTVLLGRPGSTWIDEAIEWLGPSPRPDGAWMAVAARVLQRVERDHSFVSKAKEWAKSLEQSEQATSIFEAFAECADALEAVDLVEQRLEARCGTIDAMTIFPKLWAHLQYPSKLMQMCLVDIVNWATELSEPASPSSDASSRASKAAQIVGQISSTNNQPQFWAPLCIQFLRAQPSTGFSGGTAGRLLSTLAAIRSGRLAPPIIELSEAEEFLVELAWERAEEENRYEWDRAGALAGLIRLRWNTHSPRIREAIRSFFYPNARHAGSYVLGVWLSEAECRREAMRFLLDTSIDEERRFAIRASTAARKLDVMFEELGSPHISEQDTREICRLLQRGVGDHKGNPLAAWAAWSRCETWPDVATPYLWRGILRSSIEGFTMRRDLFWPEFEAWFRISRDAQCATFLEGVGLNPLQASLPG